jgi:hypothetical protein
MLFLKQGCGTAEFSLKGLTQYNHGTRNNKGSFLQKGINPFCPFASLAITVRLGVLVLGITRKEIIIYGSYFGICPILEKRLYNEYY